MAGVQRGLESGNLGGWMPRKKGEYVTVVERRGFGDTAWTAGGREGGGVSTRDRAGLFADEETQERMADGLGW